MFKLLLLIVLLALLLAGVIAVALNHYLGWKGLVAFPFVVIALLWLGKFVVKGLFKRLTLGLIAGKSQALRGAALQVHSVTPVARPLETDEHEHDHEDEDIEEDQDEDDTSEDSDEQKETRHFYAVDLTITPRDGDAKDTWEPGELILASGKISDLRDISRKQVGIADEVMVWTGSGFGVDGPGKYSGAIRLKVIFAVQPGTAKAWLNYYNEAIGTVEFPAWTCENDPPRQRSTQRTARAARESAAKRTEAQEEAAKRARRGGNFKTGGGRPEPELTLYEPSEDEMDQPVDADLSMDEIDAEIERIDARKLDSVPLGASRFGGVPDLPPGLAWPELRGRKLPFLAQIDLSTLPKSALPSDGWLFAFGLCHDDHHPTPIRVFHHRGPRTELVRAARPADKDIWEDWTGSHGYRVVPLKSAEEEGWEECGQVFGEIDEEGEDAASVADGQDASGEDWITLLIIPSVGSMEWSDGGLFHIAIRREDLAKPDFTKVCAGLSCVG